MPGWCFAGVGIALGLYLIMVGLSAPTGPAVAPSDADDRRDQRAYSGDPYYVAVGAALLLVCILAIVFSGR